MRKLGIIGCGWLGEKIAKSASSEFEIFCTTTSKRKLNIFEKDNYHPSLIEFSDTKENNYQNLFKNCDIIIITVPFSRRTALTILNQRFRNIINFLGDYKNQLFLCSSTGVYPQIDELISENSLPENQLNQNIFSIEKLMREIYPHINILRFGGLMGEDRFFSKYYQNKEIAEPNQSVNHTHFEDICKVILKLIKVKIKGELFNVVAPKHPSKMEVFKCQTQNDCEEITAQKTGKRVSSEKLIETINYKFIHPNPAKF